MTIYKEYKIRIDCSIDVSETETKAIEPGEKGVFVEALPFWPQPEEYLVFYLKVKERHPSLVTDYSYYDPAYIYDRPAYIGIIHKYGMIFFTDQEDKIGLFEPTSNSGESNANT